MKESIHIFKKTIFIFTMIILSALFLCACGKNKNVDMVKNGYMGEYTDITTQEFFDGYYINYMGYETAEWDGGTADKDKELVQVTYKSSDEYMDDVTIQFTVLDGKYFTVSTFVDPLVEINESSDLLAELNMDYMIVYLQNHSEVAEDPEAENKFIRYLDTISGSSVLYGAAADYVGDRSLLCEKFGDTPLDTSVPWLLDSSDYLDIMDYELFFDYNSLDSLILMPSLTDEVQSFLNAMPINGMLQSNYANVLGADIKEVLYQCTDSSIDYSQVRQAIEDSGDSVELDVSFIRGATLNKLLTEITGYGLDNFELSQYYLESIDTYYIQHGDTHYNPIICESVYEIGDNLYQASYRYRSQYRYYSGFDDWYGFWSYWTLGVGDSANNEIYYVTLSKTESGFHIVSNEGI